MNQPPAKNIPAKILDDLAANLRQLAAAQGELCETLDRQNEAMRHFRTEVMRGEARRQESLHRRVLRLETDRRRLAQQAAAHAGLAPGATLSEVAKAYPTRRDELLALRDELRRTSAAAAERSQAGRRLVGGVLQQLNSTLRLVTKSGVYEPSGAFVLPPFAPRLQAIG